MEGGRFPRVDQEGPMQKFPQVKLMTQQPMVRKGEWLLPELAALLTLILIGYYI